MTPDPKEMAEAQLRRLAGTARLLDVRLHALPVPQHKLGVTWRRQILNNMIANWVRGELHDFDRETLAVTVDDAKPAEMKVGKELDLRKYAEETVALVRDILDETTASLSIDRAFKGSLNRQRYYLQQEIDAISRIFRL